MKKQTSTIDSRSIFLSVLLCCVVFNMVGYFTPKFTIYGVEYQSFEQIKYLLWALLWSVLLLIGSKD